MAKLGAVYRTRETVREYRAMSKEEQGKVKDIGGFVGGRLNGGHRKNEAVVDRCLVTLDAVHAGWNIDATGDDFLDAYRGLLECMELAEEEGPPENERSVIIH